MLGLPDTPTSDVLVKAEVKFILSSQSTFDDCKAATDSVSHSSQGVCGGWRERIVTCTLRCCWIASDRNRGCELGVSWHGLGILGVDDPMVSRQYFIIALSGGDSVDKACA